MKYFSTLKFGMREIMAYRFELVLWLIIAVAHISVAYFLWHAIFSISGATQIREFTFDGIIAYYVTAVMVTWMIYNTIEMDFAEDVRTGTLFNKIIKPASLYGQYIFQRLGYKVIAILFQGIPMALIAILIFKLTTTPAHFILFLVSLILAVFLCFSFSFLFGMSAFWLTKIGGLVRIKTGIEDLINGFIIPLTFFPASVQTILAFLPFPYMVFVPVQIFLGNYSIVESLQKIGLQAIWLAIIYLLILGAWQQAQKRLEVVGV